MTTVIIVFFWKFLLQEFINLISLFLSRDIISDLNCIPSFIMERATPQLYKTMILKEADGLISHSIRVQFNNHLLHHHQTYPYHLQVHQLLQLLVLVQQLEQHQQQGQHHQEQLKNIRNFTKGRENGLTTSSSSGCSNTTSTTRFDNISNLGTNVGSKQCWPIWCNSVISGSNQCVDLIRCDLSTTIVKGQNS